MKTYLPATLIFYAAFAFGEIVIPVEIQYGNPVATVRIGDRDLRLIVDSGGYSLGLRPEVVDVIDVKPNEERTSTTDVHGSTNESLSFTVPVIEIGGHEFTDLPAYQWAMPESLAQRSPVIDGTLGRDFLNLYVAVYDYENETITLYDSGESIEAYCSGVEVPLREHAEQIIATDVEVDHGTLRAIWDTGATHSFLKESVAIDREIPLESLEGTAGAYESQTFGLNGSEFGPLHFVVLPYTEPQEIDVFIGRNVFAEHVVCINFQSGWLRVHPN